MSIGPDSLPGPETIAGDPHSPDARIIDSLVEDHAAPPTPTELPTEKLAPVIDPKPISRMLTGSSVVQASWSPILLMPADPHRKTLMLWAASATSTDYVRIGDDPGKLQTVQASALLYSAQLLNVQPFAHTGPVWVSCPDATGPVTVTWLAVTS